LLRLDPELRFERVDACLEREPPDLEPEGVGFVREAPDRDPELARAIWFSSPETAL
jgi:hypothetical protein